MAIYHPLTVVELHLGVLSSFVLTRSLWFFVGSFFSATSFHILFDPLRLSRCAGRRVSQGLGEPARPHSLTAHLPMLPARPFFLLEPQHPRSVDLGKHSVCTHFPKDRNCEICQRTKITRAPCRRRNGGAVPRAEHFGGLITADHKVLSENCESRNNHQHAIVVQDLATQWIQSYPCKTKTSQETQKFLEPNRKPKVIYTDNSVELGKACEDLSWNHSLYVDTTQIGNKMGLLKEQCAE